MQHIKNLGRVALVAYLTALPGGFILQFQTEAPFWYKALASLVAAIAIAMLALLIGAITLIAARDKENGGLKVAVIATAIASLFFSFSAMYPMLRQ